MISFIHCIYNNSCLWINDIDLFAWISLTAVSRTYFMHYFKDKETFCQDLFSLIVDIFHTNDNLSVHVLLFAMEAGRVIHMGPFYTSSVTID